MRANKLIISPVLSLTLVFACPAQAGTATAGHERACDFGTIQAGVNAASAGDTVLVLLMDSPSATAQVHAICTLNALQDLSQCANAGLKRYLWDHHKTLSMVQEKNTLIPWERNKK